MMSNSVDIVIPAYNEEKNLIKLIDTLKAVRRSDLFNVIIVNNGSTVILSHALLMPRSFSATHY